MRSPIVDDDLRHAFQLTHDLWEQLRGARLFVTGGTGFFGTSLLESFALANESLALQAEMVVLSRNPAAFQSEQPHLTAHPAIRFHTGDVKSFDFPEGAFTHVIHGAATSARETFQKEDIVRKFDTVVAGTRRALEFAAASGAKKFLYTSSGVVYGRQPGHMTHVPEDYNGAPATTDSATLSAWGTSKRTAEFLCGCYAAKHGFEVKIARCFSFAGPGLPLDLHYAIGNFIRDGLQGGPIRILGDGTPRRSYLYTSDLIAWLWTILLNGASLTPYNVGSEQDVSIGELAYLVAANLPSRVDVHIARTPAAGVTPDRYVPSTSRARATLGLRETVDLQQAIRRMIAHVTPGSDPRP
jgi:nucleoside-diphosphate-sugar epimerase